MHFLYLDDSGSVGNTTEEYFVLGGICVPEASIRWLTSELDKLARSIDPISPEAVEFHAAEIFSGRSEPWKSRSKNDRIEIIKSVLCILDRAFPEIVIFACAIHKKSFPAEDPVLMAYEDLSGRFNIHLERNLGPDGRGLVIVDKSSYETGLQTLAASFRQTGNRWGQQLRRIIEIPLFVDSKASRIIQLADHIAYAVFRRYNANDLTYYNCIENRFYSSDGVLHGLVHRQIINRNCTCPACITRRDRPQVG
jgi:hypothetical protein